jgi:site-specific recombinase XerD
MRITLHRLTWFLDSQGIFSPKDIALENLNGYIKTSVCDYCKQRVSHELRTMRRFMKYLYESGTVKVDLSEAVMKVRNATEPSHLPSAFSADEVERLLSVVDRNSPVGKRDYAILMVAAKLGLRVCDIRLLRFENIDWENNAVRLAQRKTGEPVSLFLLPDVGWAIIDYCKHGRPISDSPEIFVRQVAPHVPMKNFNEILAKYIRLANIPIERMRHHGMHTLRHSLATTMLKKGTPIETIQGVLGQIDPNSTRHYLSVDIEQLKGCALEVPQ